MLFSQSLMLSDVLTENEMQCLDEYFENLAPNESDLITVSKIVKATGIDSGKVATILNRGINEKVLLLRYGIRCPDCGLINEILEREPQELGEVRECYWCEEEFEVRTENVICLFALRDKKCFFNVGQHRKVDGKKHMPDVVHEDTLAYLEKYFKPQSEYYETQIKSITQEKRLKPFKGILRFSIFVIGMLMTFYFYQIYSSDGTAIVTVIITLFLGLVIVK